MGGRETAFYHLSLSLIERPKVSFSRALFRFSAVYNDALSATATATATNLKSLVRRRGDDVLCGLSPLPGQSGAHWESFIPGRVRGTGTGSSSSFHCAPDK